MESSHRIALLVALGQQRWLLPVLAQTHAGQGARFVELRNRIGLPRESLVRALDMALELGWIVRNPGHGHPLRPEYLLSEGGALIADEAARLAAALKDAGIAPTDLTRWSLPLLQALALGAERFGQLDAALPAATPRALSQGLKALVALNLARREVTEGFPPSSRYRPTALGAELISA